MDWLQTIFLALLQGFTEFLPISSSAHLILPTQLFGWVDQGLAFDVAVHVGTLLAVVLYFRADLRRMATAWTRSLAGGKTSQDSRMAWLVVLGTVPAGLAGFCYGGMIEDNLRSALVIALTTIVFALGLWWVERRGGHERELDTLTLKDAFYIGVAQVLALVPGTSRSGITIMMGLALGLTRTAAARFSFLLSVPVILLAGLLKVVELCQSSEPVQWSYILAGTGVAFISAYLCIGWFLRVLEKIGLMPFVIYRLFLGVILLAFFV